LLVSSGPGENSANNTATSTDLVRYQRQKNSEQSTGQKSSTYSNMVIMMTLYRMLDVGLWLANKKAIIPVPKHGRVVLPKLNGKQVRDLIYSIWLFGLKLFRFDLSSTIANPY
jgi:hypothetical protein